MLNYFPCFCDGCKFIKQNIHSICASLLIALLLTDDGRLSTLLKCSAYLFKIASLSVRSVLPSPFKSNLMLAAVNGLNFSLCINAFCLFEFTSSQSS